MSASSPKNFVVWIVLALLVVGMMGFGAQGFSGSGRNLGKAGTQDISVQSYITALTTRLAAERAQDGTPMSMAQAQATGVTQQVLSGLITRRVLDNETARLGLSVGDDAVGETILQTPAFQGPDGSFSREAYAYQLERTGQSEASFEQDLRDEMARSLLQTAVLSAVPGPDTLTDVILSYSAQTRDVTWAELTEANLAAPISTPDQDGLRAYYDAHLDQFMTPETRDLSAAVLLPSMLQDSVELDEAALRALYDDRADQYQQPERRLVERLVFGEQAQAEDAAARIASGETDFETLVADRGLDLSDVDLGDVSRADLGAAADAVFAADTGAVAGPALSRLGPALYRVNAVLAEQITSFEDALPALREELGLVRATRVIAQKREGIEDLMAGGARIEDLAERTDMQQQELSWYTGSDEGLAAYAAVSAAIPTLTQDALPTLIELDDGGLVVLRLNAVTAPEPRPFEAVVADVETTWRRDELARQLDAKAAEVAALLADGASFADLGLAPQQIAGLSRADVITAAPNGFLTEAFTADQGAVARVSAQGREAVLRVDAVMAGDASTEDLAANRAQLSAALGQQIGDDLLRAYAEQLMTTTEITVDQAKVNATNARFN